MPTFLSCLRANTFCYATHIYPISRKTRTTYSFRIENIILCLSDYSDKLHYNYFLINYSDKCWSKEKKEGWLSCKVLKTWAMKIFRKHFNVHWYLDILACLHLLHACKNIFLACLFEIERYFWSSLNTIFSASKEIFFSLWYYQSWPIIALKPWKKKKSMLLFLELFKV